MSSRRGARRLRIALAALPLAGAAGGEAAGQAYGTDTQTLVVAAPEFVGREGGAPVLAYDSFFYFNSPGSATPRDYFAPVHLPAGAVVTAIQCWVNDASAANDVTFSFERVHHDVLTDLPGIFVIGGFWGSAAALGYQHPGSPVLNHTIEYTDGNRRNVYYLHAELTDDTSFQQCRVSWHRTITPAPGSPTFGDVPTDYLYFRAIEALADSGITSGCGEGNFCPNQNVTRGEIAAFFARALGLHWPQ
jgi:hypothetical protein